MAYILTAADFSTLLHAQFLVDPGQAPPLELELNRVEVRPSPPTQERFSLFFRGPRDRFLPQRLYRFYNETTGAFDLFIVPIGQDQDAFTYEAVFNRTRN